MNALELSRALGGVDEKLVEDAAPEGAAAYGGLTDWAVGRLGIPSFTIECGEGKNPLPESAFPSAWREIRPLLFRAPLYAAPPEKQKGDAGREYRTL